MLRHSLKHSLKSRLETSAAPALVVTKDVPIVLAKLRMEIGISAAATGLVWYVDISSFKFYKIFADVHFREKVQCIRGRWTEIRDCGRGTCHGTNDGAAVC